MTDGTAKRTPLHALHVELGAKMVTFAGYDMPIQYDLGVLKEHQQVREACGIFDVSHMGQAWLIGDSQATVCEQMERVLPAEIMGLASGKQQYTQMLDENGGILDDLIISKPAESQYNDRLYTVVNAGCKETDFAHIQSHTDGITIERLEDRALIAVQGPKAIDVVAEIIPAVTELTFMTIKSYTWTAGDGNAVEVLISRSGYTGEDGFEISIPAPYSVEFTKVLLTNDHAEMIGLGARDSLRLEAGLCLYGNDLDTTTTPIEAGLLWSIGKRRRTDGGFMGANVVQQQIADGALKKRIGLDIDGRAPCRAGTEIFAGDTKIGTVTSGSFGPTVGKPVAMGYVAKEHSTIGTQVTLNVRGKSIPATVCKMPFSVQNYKR